MLKTGSSVRHPLESLLYLVLLAFLGTLVFSIVGIALGGLWYGWDLVVHLADSMAGNTPESLGFMKIIQAFSTIGTFIVPALVFARIESPSPIAFLKMNRLNGSLLGLGLLLFFCVMPFLEFTILLNKAMKLPAFLQELEAWMLAKEDQMEELTKKLLQMNNWRELLVNLLIIAVLPAIGEEFFFRGSLQQTIGRWIKNDHAAIWITAIIFSAIHMQFYGFLPRMLLGVLLGYVFVWGRSIWLAVALHFCNNAFSVIGAYILLQKGRSLDEMDAITGGNYLLYAISFFLSLMILTYFYRAWKAEESPRNLV